MLCAGLTASILSRERKRMTDAREPREGEVEFRSIARMITYDDIGKQIAKAPMYTSVGWMSAPLPRQTIVERQFRQFQDGAWTDWKPVP